LECGNFLSHLAVYRMNGAMASVARQDTNLTRPPAGNSAPRA
jgi:hypothetical protein